MFSRVALHIVWNKSHWSTVEYNRHPVQSCSWNVIGFPKCVHIWQSPILICCATTHIHNTSKQRKPGNEWTNCNKLCLALTVAENIFMPCSIRILRLERVPCTSPPLLLLTHSIRLRAYNLQTTGGWNMAHAPVNEIVIPDILSGECIRDFWFSTTYKPILRGMRETDFVVFLFYLSISLFICIFVSVLVDLRQREKKKWHPSNGKD